MHTQVLIVGSQVQQLQDIVSGLDDRLDWMVAVEPAAASAYLRQNPQLILLQLETMVPDGAGSPLWFDFLRSCEFSAIRTLLFSVADAEGDVEKLRTAVLPWCTGVLDISLPSTTQLEYLRLQLCCQRLEQSLELAEGRLFEKNLELQEGLQSAAYIQQALVAHDLPDLPKLQFASSFVPCQSVGGDIFNVMRLDEETVMVYMLDVSGHGVSAAMVTVSVFQALSPHTGKIVKSSQDQPPYYRITAPEEVLRQLDSEYPFERFDKFFTMNYFLINPNSGSVRFANAAHPPAVVVRADGSLEHLDAEGTIVGMGGLVPYEQGQLTLEAGDRLFLYTDGIIEHENGAKELFGQQRLDGLLRKNSGQPLQKQCRDVIDALHQFGGDRPFMDDVTLLGIGFGI